MHSLLARQIRKFLDPKDQNTQKLDTFLHAIDKSYHNYEEQFSMLQRAMDLSSKELYEANQKLQQEAEQQKKVIARLTDATKTLQAITIKNHNKNRAGSELSGIELAVMIEEQAYQISEAEKQRELLLQDLEKSNKELNDYAHVVSHDLKSPLRSINTLISWIKEDSDQLEPTLTANLDMIDQNIEKMDNLISGILEYSVIDDKSKNLEKEINLHDIVQGIIRLLPIPDHINITIQNPLPTIYADPSRMKQLFQNLLNNAVNAIDKKEGTITILFEDEKDFRKFGIKDNGKGIPKKYHNKIFQMFQTLDMQKKSTGIGLSIVKKIVEFYQGNIWVESQEGIGTTFFFTLKKLGYE